MKKKFETLLLIPNASDTIIFSTIHWEERRNRKKTKFKKKKQEGNWNRTRGIEPTIPQWAFSHNRPSPRTEIRMRAEPYSSLGAMYRVSGISVPSSAPPAAWMGWCTWCELRHCSRACSWPVLLHSRQNVKLPQQFLTWQATSTA